MGKRQKGISLIELIIAMSVLTIILSSLGYYISVTLRYFQLMETQIRMQQKATNAFTTISSEMSNADNANVIIDSDKAGVIFLSPRQDDGTVAFNDDGEIIWQKWVAYYTKTSGDTSTIIRKEEKISSPSSTPPSAPYANTSLFAASANAERVIATGVKSLSIESAGYDDGYKITVTLDGKDAQSKTIEIQGETEVKVMN